MLLQVLIGVIVSASIVVPRYLAGDASVSIYGWGVVSIGLLLIAGMIEKLNKGNKK